MNYTEENILEKYKYTPEERTRLYSMHNSWFEQFSTVIIDECHEMFFATRIPFMSKFTSAYVIGLSSHVEKEIITRISFRYYDKVISNTEIILHAAKTDV